jgi:hypothetical protein
MGQPCIIHQKHVEPILTPQTFHPFYLKDIHNQPHKAMEEDIASDMQEEIDHDVEKIPT